MDVSGNYLYLTGGPTNDLRIFGLTNPAAPTVLGSVAVPSGGVQFAAHHQNHSYISAADKLYVVDHNNKNLPVVLPNPLTVPNAGQFGMRQLAIYGNVLYGALESGVNVYDISNPGQPTLLTTLPNGAFALTVDPVQARLFVSQGFGNNGHHVYDISTPSAPVPLFSGSGGTSTPGRLAYSLGLLLQTGPDNLPTQTVNAYTVDNSSSNWQVEHTGSRGFAVTDIEATDSTFIVAKHGGIEILNGQVVVGTTPGRDSEKLAIWPNPASGAVHFRTAPSTERQSLVVRDLVGKTHLHRTVTHSELEWSLTDLAAGLYLVTLLEDDRPVATQRLSVR
ncbi:MAG: T9SS type A sorting domain-containing protein [Bacteroidota bacterium]